MIHDGYNIHEELIDSADAVVIGTGAGGAPMAWRLAKAGKKVIVIETGGEFTAKDFNRDAWDVTKRTYKGMGTMVTMGKPAVALPIGNTLGGTTTINSGTCFRTPPEVVEKWRNEYGLTDITNAGLEPYFDEVEKIIHVEEVPWDLMGANNQLFAEGIKTLGYEGAPLRRNQDGCKGSGVCAFGCPTDGKKAMNLNYIPMADGEGAIIYTHAKATRILQVGGHVIGVEGHFLRPDESEPGAAIRIRTPVVALCAGSIYTPIVMRLNGLGNRKHVGRHLRIHPAAKVLGIMDHSVNAWRGIPQAYYCDALAKEGIVFEGFFIPPSLLAFALPAYGVQLKQMLANYDKVIGFGVMVSDTSEGRVLPVGKSDRPLILYNLNQRDTDLFMRGIDIAARAYFAAGAQRVVLPIFGIEEARTPDDLRQLQNIRVKPSDLELAAFHPMGTCRMSADPKDGVVDARLEVHGLKGLFIADGSIFPTSLGVNPQVSIMGFATRCADYIANESRFSRQA